MKTVLVVEDEEVLADVIAEVLRSRGYDVLVGRDGTEAVQLCATSTKPIDVLLCDIVIPGASSGELVRVGLGLYSDMKVLLMSGWPDEQAIRPDICERVCVLQKPFSLDQLLVCLKCVREGNACVEASGQAVSRVVDPRSLGSALSS
jgi:two-component system cell cycle sensor histidine kinase/response regulator CckA